jgi:hypothetical protein
MHTGQHDTGPPLVLPGDYYPPRVNDFETPTIIAGALVRIHGLRSRLDLNGLLAQCLTFSRQGNRWGVRILCLHEDVEPEEVAVKACNLQLLSGIVASVPDLMRFWAFIRELADRAATDFVAHITLMVAADPEEWPDDLLCACVEQSVQCGILHIEDAGFRVQHLSLLPQYLPPARC